MAWRWNPHFDADELADAISKLKASKDELRNAAKRIDNNETNELSFELSSVFEKPRHWVDRDLRSNAIIKYLYDTSKHGWKEKRLETEIPSLLHKQHVHIEISGWYRSQSRQMPSTRRVELTLAWVLEEHGPRRRAHQTLKKLILTARKRHKDKSNLSEQFYIVPPDKAIGLSVLFGGRGIVEAMVNLKS